MLLGLLWGIPTFGVIWVWARIFDNNPPGGVWPVTILLLGVGVTIEWWAGTRSSQR